MKLEKVLKELEVNYGWSFYDENGKLHLEDMQKELLQDTIKAVKNLGISDVSGSLPDEREVILEALNRYSKPDATFGKPSSLSDTYKKEGWLACYSWIKGNDR